MSIFNTTKRQALGTALAAVLALGAGTAGTAPLMAQPTGASQPASTVNLSIGRGTLVNLSAPMSDLFVADNNIADVQVRSSTQLYVFAKTAGETTIYATSKSGKVVYSANVRVGTNIGSIDAMLRLAMPDAQIQATPMNGLMLLTGTVASPDDAAEAERLAQAFVGSGSQVISRLRTATPLQVNLQVKIAEVSRELSKQVGFNLLTRDPTGGFMFGLAQGRPDAVTIDATTGKASFKGIEGSTTLAAAGKLFGLDVLGALDLAENDGLVTTLANPNLTALSGETASFLAGGEIPIPISTTLGQISVEYKQYGVSLSFTPTVLADGRISMRVRPEVSQLSSAGSVTLNDFEIPGITTRRAETTVELGSGQSFVIGGLLNNSSNNSMEKAPFLGDLPILGALFRSKRWNRAESELVIVVTPYLVKPVSANQIALPTDGYRAANDAESFLLGQTYEGKTGQKRPLPSAGAPQTVKPGVSPDASPSAALPGEGLPGNLPQQPTPKVAQAQASPQPKGNASAKPGFSFD
ncbi:type II and III secretion system protein family protein [Sphingomonas colocasiae]|uniref:Type II and III secretion system protein family protein n=1 Tax=Sphingomonas colocasiae TaxID=1848973 RepID=A0ABS7PN79_9SPHN|nr:type II and III secretion system protein family protein [Sphingomonas colocasiae]MBY8822759.1 type II and III secretion system protein family protein [Sphingomonas colocasiae]